MRVRSAAIAVLATALGLSLAGCGGGTEEPPTATESPSQTPTDSPVETEEPATELVEIAPFTDDGGLAKGWSVDESTLQGGYSIPADTCRASEHGAGGNTIACGSTADALSACWLTAQPDRIACLDEIAPEAKTLRLIQLDSAAPATTKAAADPEPLWLELDEGAMFQAVNGGAYSPPEGYLVAYQRIDDGAPERFEEVLVPDDESAPAIDRSMDMWSVAVGGDGEGTDTIETEQVVRAWVLAGRTLPEAPTDDAETSEPTPESFNGRWCEAPQSSGSTGCVTIAYPEYTIESTGQTWSFTGLTEQDGQYTLNAADAPFGTYFPAGTSIPAEMLMGMQDSPDEDRLYSGQSGMMLLRE